jgi:hypothetical protein
MHHVLRLANSGSHLPINIRIDVDVENGMIRIQSTKDADTASLDSTETGTLIRRLDHRNSTGWASDHICFRPPETGANSSLHAVPLSPGQ